MDKYEGITRAEALVSERVYVTKSRAPGILWRWIAAALLAAVCFGCKYAGWGGAAAYIREAVCYDMLGNETGGTVVDAIIESQ